MENLFSQIVVGIGGLGAGAWAMYQKIQADNRNNKSAEITDAAWNKLLLLYEKKSNVCLFV